MCNIKKMTTIYLHLKSHFNSTATQLELNHHFCSGALLLEPNLVLVDFPQTTYSFIQSLNFDQLKQIAVFFRANCCDSFFSLHWISSLSNRKFPSYIFTLCALRPTKYS